MPRRALLIPHSSYSSYATATLMPLRTPGSGSHTPDTKANARRTGPPALGADGAAIGRHASRRTAVGCGGGRGGSCRCGGFNAVATVQRWAPVGCTAGASMRGNGARDGTARRVYPTAWVECAGAAGENGEQEGVQDGGDAFAAAAAATAAATAAGVGAVAPDAGTGGREGGRLRMRAPLVGARPPRPPAGQDQVQRGLRPVW